MSEEYGYGNNVELETGNENLTDLEVDAIADVLVSGLIKDVEQNKIGVQMEMEDVQYEREGGLFGVLGKLFLGTKVPKTAVEKFSKSVKSVLIWGSILVVVIVGAVYYFKKQSSPGF